ncbi:Hypothetical predicted protein [Cloeon dipterum]|nr:Hypothetical predicted protein [Cloeon dipterum]
MHEFHIWRAGLKAGVGRSAARGAALLSPQPLLARERERASRLVSGAEGKKQSVGSVSRQSSARGRRMGRLKAAFSLQYRRLVQDDACCRCTATRKAEQLSSIVGNAFRMAYAAQLQKQTSPFGQLIASPPILTAKTSSWSPQKIQNLGECSQDSPNNLNKSDVSNTSGEESVWGVCPPLPPERVDSLGGKAEEEERALLAAPWFQAGIPREIALEVLAQEPVGSFMVRESTTKFGCYALSLRVPRDFQPSGIAHYLILRTNRGYRIKGFTKEFSSMMALITHHSVMPELLPCPLSLSRYNPSFARPSAADADADPDYNTLADFRRMMAELA